MALCALGVLLALCFTSHTTTAAIAKQEPTKAQKKMEVIMARGPILTASDTNFTRYAEGNSRPYHLVVLFTAAGPAYNCAACRMIEEPYVKVANAYAQQHNYLNENPVVFLRTDIASASHTFQKFGIKTAPHVYLVPRGIAIPAEPELSTYEFTRGMSKPDGNLDDFLHDFNAITGSKLVIYPSTEGLLGSAVLMAVVLGILGHFFAEVPSRVITFIRHRALWHIVSLLCYMTGVGGMIFCIIRNPKTHGFDQKTGEPDLFSPGGREQFWYEGVVIAFFYLAMSITVVFLYGVAGWRRSPKVVRSAAVLACLTFLCYLSVVYFSMYSRKTAWYSLPQLLPSGLAELHKGPLKRKHGLLKRVVRLSHLWLNEYTDLTAFRVKFRTLLWDYIVRHVLAVFRV